LIIYPCFDQTDGDLSSLAVLINSLMMINLPVDYKLGGVCLMNRDNLLSLPIMVIIQRVPHGGENLSPALRRKGARIITV
jgi:hypothetical protein